MNDWKTIGALLSLGFAILFAFSLKDYIISVYGAITGIIMGGVGFIILAMWLGRNAFKLF